MSTEDQTESAKAPIYPTLEAAYEAHDRDGLRCPKASGGDPSGHWWLLDHEAGEAAALAADDLFFEAIFCACRTCGAKMLLSPDAPEYPPV